MQETWRSVSPKLLGHKHLSRPLCHYVPVYRTVFLWGNGPIVAKQHVYTSKKPALLRAHHFRCVASVRPSKFYVLDSHGLKHTPPLPPRITSCKWSKRPFSMEKVATLAPLVLGAGVWARSLVSGSRLWPFRSHHVRACYVYTSKSRVRNVCKLD